MGFQLDTSGEVVVSVDDATHLDRVGHYVWSDLSPFTQGYIEALFASLDDDIGAELGVLGRKSPTFSDLAPETLARIIADCEAAATARGSDGYEATGLEFWKVRQAGLIDAFPPLTVQLGDDGKVRFAPTPTQGADDERV